MIERGQCLKAVVAKEIQATEAELASAVSAPAEGNVDPTSWLPNELVIMILFHALYTYGAPYDGCQRCKGCARDGTRCVEIVS